MRGKILYISAVGELNYTRTTLLLSAFADAGYKIGAICPGERAQSLPGRALVHCKVRKPAANFWYDRGMINTCRAMLDRIWGSLQVAWYLWREQPDIVVCSEPDSWAISCFYKLTCGGAVVADVREVYEDRALAFPKVFQGAMRRFLRWGMSQAAGVTDAILHVSEERQAVYGFLATTGSVIACYPEVAGFRPRGDRGAPPLAGAPGLVTAIHVGALRCTYAADELLRAVALATDGGLRFRLLVIGGVAGKIKENDLLSRLQATGAVEMCGQVPFAEVRRRMSEAQIGISLVLPIDTAHRLAQPQKLYEYLAAGIPVIGANVPTIRRVLEVHHCGLPVDAESPDDIAAAFRKLVEDEELRREMGVRGRRAAEMYFDWKFERARLLRVVVGISESRARERGAVR